MKYNNIKKITLCLILTGFSLAFSPLQSKADDATATSSVMASKSREEAKANTLLLRLNEINAMDKSNLNSSDKRNLRKEVRSIKEQLRDLGGGVYISVGALILILVLLIILL